LSGSGKTLSALLLARGLVRDKEDPKIFVIDTEAGSSQLYTDAITYGIDFPFYVVPLEKFSPKEYDKLMEAAIAEGADVLIIDSISPAWDSEGGILDQKSNYDASGVTSKTGFFSWDAFTKKQNTFFEHIRKTPIHTICTVRGKAQYDTVGGIKKLNSIGFKQRKDVEYEFDMFGEIDKVTHEMEVTKSRFVPFPVGWNGIIDIETGGILADWNSSGVNISELTKVAVVNLKESLFGNENAMRLLLADYGVTKPKELPASVLERIAAKDFDLLPYLEKSKEIEQSLEKTTDN
jgi:hypothetical protein